MPNDTPAPDRLSPLEIHRLIHQLVGVTSGYLVGFSYQTHVEFYPRYCDLDIDPMQYQGTTRDRFEQILRMSDGATQAKIVAGILKKFPIESFPDEERGQKAATNR
jgi:hypothetical protein